MRINVNGKTIKIESSRKEPTLSNILKDLGHNPKQIVVEYNGIILPPHKWDKQKVKNEDSLEIVTIVGGGS